MVKYMQIEIPKFEFGIKILCVAFYFILCKYTYKQR